MGRYGWRVLVSFEDAEEAADEMDDATDEVEDFAIVFNMEGVARARCNEWSGSYFGDGFNSTVEEIFVKTMLKTQ